MSLKKFVQTKKKYCISYFGNNNEYIKLLRLLRPTIESQFSGVEIYLACKDEAFYLLQDEPRVCKKNNLIKINIAMSRK